MNYDIELMEKQLNGFDGFDGSHGFDGLDMDWYPYSTWIWIGFGFMDQWKMDYGLDMEQDFNPSGPTPPNTLNKLCHFYATFSYFTSLNKYIWNLYTQFSKYIHQKIS